ncbi:MAG: glutamine synthetase, partial [Negativicutes bacterium]|nr:glutamine synthetase [Negativicutes bacterium]
MIREDLTYVIDPRGKTAGELAEMIGGCQEIKFVSLVGIDLAGNDTDERIPVGLFLRDMEDFFSGRAVQTDGSSVVLTGIATLNNAKVDMIADRDVYWFVDYNADLGDQASGKPVGTLRVPAFLRHDGRRVDSRSILKNSLDYVRQEIIALLAGRSAVAGLAGLPFEEIADIEFSVGTELEFWVKTPAQTANVEELSATQVIQENYWQRTRGKVRTALEHSLLLLEKYGLRPEMGHKEVGGVKAQIDSSGELSHVLEQLEIDWRYADALQAADNELWARSLIKEVFRSYGLEVTFKAKPIIGVAGNGEHTHVGLAARLRDGRVVNLFSPDDPAGDFLSAVGYGAIMGLLKNYE